jgi:hypothetical protein
LGPTRSRHGDIDVVGAAQPDLGLDLAGGGVAVLVRAGGA